VYIQLVWGVLLQRDGVVVGRINWVKLTLVFCFQMEKITTCLWAKDNVPGQSEIFMGKRRGTDLR
jgi:hypothetical protein